MSPARFWLRWLVFAAAYCAAPLTVAASPADIPPAVTGSTFPDDPYVNPEQMPPGAATNYLLGKTLFEEGEYRAALPYLQRAYQLSPDTDSIARSFFRTLIAVGAHTDALIVLDDLVARYPDDWTLLRMRARLHTDLKQYDAALRDLQVLTEEGADDVDLLVMEATILVRDERADEALAVYRRGLADFPEEREQIYLMMASLLDHTERLDELSALLDEALAQLPESRGLRLAFVRYLVLAGSHERALAVAAEGDRLQGTVAPRMLDDSTAEGDFSFMIELADLLVREGKFHEAVEILDGRFQAGELGLDECLWLARLLLGMGRVEEGSAFLPEIVARWPDSGDAHHLWGRVLVEQDRLTDARVSLLRAAELEPHRPDIRLALVRVLLILHGENLAAADTTNAAAAIRTELAEQTRAANALVHADDAHGHLILGYAYQVLEDLDRAASHFASAQNDPRLELDAGLQLSFCWNELGLYAKARRVLENLRADHPGDANLANTLGYLLAERGEDLVYAEELVAEALASEPENGAYLDSMGWVFYQRGDYQQAFDYLVQAVNQLPLDPVILEHLALTLRELGETDRALGVLRQSLAAGGDPSKLNDLMTAWEMEESD